MTLDKAIRHALDVAASETACPECRKEHEQLAAWLQELKKYRKEREKEIIGGLGHGSREKAFVR